MRDPNSLQHRLRGFIPKPLRPIAVYLVAKILVLSASCSAMERRNRARKLEQAKKRGFPFVGRVPVTQCLMLLEPSHFITKTWFVDGDFEPGVVKVMRRLVNTGMTCIDLGANAGYFTLVLSKLVGGLGTVYAFEPTRMTYARLRNNLGLNLVENVVAEELAVGNICGEIVLYEGPPGYDVYNTVGKLVQHLETIANQFTKRSVCITSLDQYCQSHSITKVNFIKLDIEGGEWAALKGAEQVIINNPDMSMVIEVSPDMAVSSGYCVKEMLDWLIERSFKLFILKKSGELAAIHNSSGVAGMVVAIREKYKPSH